MLTSETKQLLERIAKAMRPAQPPWHQDNTVITEWCNTIQSRNLDPEDVRAIFDDWTQNGNTRWPSLYQFRDMARKTRKQQPADTPHDVCHQCHNTGWIYQHDTRGEELTMQRNGHTYSYVTVCGCRHGQHAEQTELWKTLCND